MRAIIPLIASRVAPIARMLFCMLAMPASMLVNLAMTSGAVTTLRAVPS